MTHWQNIPSLRTDRVRLLIFVKRKDEMNFDDWSRYWLETHGPIFANTQAAKENIIRYEQLHVNQHAKQILQERGYKVPDFDGVVMFEVESLENLNDLLTSEEWSQKVMPDADKIFEQEGNSSAVYGLSTLHDRQKPKALLGTTLQDGRVQLLVQMKKKAGLSQEEFEKHWLKEYSSVTTGHGPTKEGLSKYEQLHIRRGAIPEMESRAKVPSDWDGIALFEAESVDKLISVLRHEAYLAQAEPAREKFLDKENSRFLPVDVAVLIDKEA
ncbi:hypothetical protein VNI00_004466 [Paramarasmius palmivorus]|uniref:EthD domain-containing protein n=1 Tax=Paramarasmius palmivorus TaxID=297713 RepID=A0AAW0DIX1_9AGAR